MSKRSHHRGLDLDLDLDASRRRVRGAVDVAFVVIGGSGGADRRKLRAAEHHQLELDRVTGGERRGGVVTGTAIGPRVGDGSGNAAAPAGDLSSDGRGPTTMIGAGTGAGRTDSAVDRPVGAAVVSTRVVRAEWPIAATRPKADAAARPVARIREAPAG